MSTLRANCLSCFYMHPRFTILEAQQPWDKRASVRVFLSSDIQCIIKFEISILLAVSAGAGLTLTVSIANTKQITPHWQRGLYILLSMLRPAFCTLNANIGAVDHLFGVDVSLDSDMVSAWSRHPTMRLTINNCWFLPFDDQVTTVLYY